MLNSSQRHSIPLKFVLRRKHTTFSVAYTTDDIYNYPTFHNRTWRALHCGQSPHEELRHSHARNHMTFICASFNKKSHNILITRLAYRSDWSSWQKKAENDPFNPKIINKARGIRQNNSTSGHRSGQQSLWPTNRPLDPSKCRLKHSHGILWSPSSNWTIAHEISLRRIPNRSIISFFRSIDRKSIIIVIESIVGS